VYHESQVTEDQQPGCIQILLIVETLGQLALFFGPRIGIALTVRTYASRSRPGDRAFSPSKFVDM
jgi:hypothetical protein